MHTTAIIDIGSNTIVLVIYQIDDTGLHQLYYQSIAAHLVACIQDRKMSEEGLQKAQKIIRGYLEKCQEMHVGDIYGDVTECGRNLVNQDAFLSAIKEAGLANVRLLTGEEEAMCDFYGTTLDCQIPDGLMIDIGGGSTEFVSFQNRKIQDAVSIPLGCVRLSAMKPDPSVSKEAIENMRLQHPSLSNSDMAIGVGGTIRACRKTVEAVKGNQQARFLTEDLLALYTGLKQEDPAWCKAAKENVTPDRLPVLVPGLGMLVAASQSFGIREFVSSEYGVREGFLLHFVLKRL
ncbi:MAG: hypothetical protein SOI44_06350 [Lactimicrobium sp.]|jgi:exopolyphosphatase/guanosine-5'-triphosphate,3'-diphosphate pyrophosphatase|uniref:Ppx/GppA phosphatase family protein n=1 Tax=Lactimicrobium sp. TaxID=2563780 RepID=UPI002F35D665